MARKLVPIINNVCDKKLVVNTQNVKVCKS